MGGEKVVRDGSTGLATGNTLSWVSPSFVTAKLCGPGSASAAAAGFTVMQKQPGFAHSSLCWEWSLGQQG